MIRAGNQNPVSYADQSNYCWSKKEGKMINAQLYPAEYMGFIESGLEPSEVGIAVCDFGVYTLRGALP